MKKYIVFLINISILLNLFLMNDKIIATYQILQFPSISTILLERYGISLNINSKNWPQIIIERSVDNQNNFTPIATISNSNVYFIDDKILDGYHTYYYRIKGKNNNTESGYSNIVSINAIKSPSNFSGNYLGNNTIRFTWNYNDSNSIDGFKIDRCLISWGSEICNYSINVDKTKRSYDYTINDYNQYTYKIVAYKGDKISYYSNSFNFQLPISGFQSFTLDSDYNFVKINFSILNNFNNFYYFYYKIYRNNNLIYLSYIYNSPTITYTDFNLKEGTTYKYQIEVCNTSFLSCIKSDVKTVTTKKKTYNWYTSDWKTNSVTCGIGIKTRTVECKDNEGNVVEDSNCISPKPITTETYEITNCSMGDYKYNGTISPCFSGSVFGNDKYDNEGNLISYSCMYYGSGYTVKFCKDENGVVYKPGEKIQRYLQSNSNTCGNPIDIWCKSDGNWSRSTQNLYQTCYNNCKINDNLWIKHNENIDLYSVSQTEYPNKCENYKKTFACNNGNLSNSQFLNQYKNQNCTDVQPKDCTINRKTYKHGEYINFYKSDIVEWDESCDDNNNMIQKQCINGQIEPINQYTDYRYTSCKSKDKPKDCTINLNGKEIKTIAHNESIIVYQTPTVPYRSTCISEKRTCIDGNLSGSFLFDKCEVSPASKCSAGEYLSNGQCFICEKGYYCPDGINKYEAKKGTFTDTNGGTGAKSVYECSSLYLCEKGERKLLYKNTKEINEEILSLYQKNNNFLLDDNAKNLLNLLNSINNDFSDILKNTSWGSNLMAFIGFDSPISANVSDLENKFKDIFDKIKNYSFENIDFPSINNIYDKYISYISVGKMLSSALFNEIQPNKIIERIKYLTSQKNDLYSLISEISTGNDLINSLKKSLADYAAFSDKYNNIAISNDIDVSVLDSGSNIFSYQKNQGIKLYNDILDKYIAKFYMDTLINGSGSIYDELSKRNEELKKLQEEKQKVLSEATFLQTKLDIINKEIKDIEEENRSMKDEMNTLSSSIVVKNRHIDSQKNMLSTLINVDKKDIDNVISSGYYITGLMENVSRWISWADGVLMNLDLESFIKDIDRKISVLQAQIDSMQKDLDNKLYIKDQVLSDTKIVAFYKNDVQNVEKLTKLIEQTKSGIIALESQIAEKQKELDKLNEELITFRSNKIQTVATDMTVLYDLLKEAYESQLAKENYYKELYQKVFGSSSTVLAVDKINDIKEIKSNTGFIALKESLNNLKALSEDLAKDNIFIKRSVPVDAQIIVKDNTEYLNVYNNKHIPYIKYLYSIGVLKNNGKDILIDSLGNVKNLYDQKIAIEKSLIYDDFKFDNVKLSGQLDPFGKLSLIYKGDLPQNGSGFIIKLTLSGGHIAYGSILKMTKLQTNKVDKWEIELGDINQDEMVSQIDFLQAIENWKKGQKIDINKDTYTDFNDLAALIRSAGKIQLINQKLNVETASKVSFTYKIDNNEYQNVELIQ